MAAEILATGSGAANSTDQTIAAGITVGYVLKGYGQDAAVAVYGKDEVAGYTLIGIMDAGQPSRSISTPGVYRFSRLARSGACGVSSL
jgi:hypothetical protein